MQFIPAIFGGAIQLQPAGQFVNLGNITISGLVSAAVIILLVIASLILIFILIAGGIAVMVSGRGGNAQQSEKGSKAITGAIIGLVIIFGAWAIITLLNAFFGINILSLAIPTAH